MRDVGNRPQPPHHPMSFTKSFRRRRAKSDGKEGAPHISRANHLSLRGPSCSAQETPNISVAYSDFTIGLWQVI